MQARPCLSKMRALAGDVGMSGVLSFDKTKMVRKDLAPFDRG
jgi:hypothetical protein